MKIIIFRTKLFQKTLGRNPIVVRCLHKTVIRHSPVKKKYKFFKKYKTSQKVFPFFFHYSLKNKKFSFDRKLSVLIKSNNIFCNLRNLVKKKTILSRSRGHYRIRVSRKLLKHNATRIITEFCKEARQELTHRGLFISLVAPIKLRKNIIELLKVLRVFKLKGDKKKYFRPLILKMNDKKCFNGCRSAKRKRKKRIKMRLKK